MCIRDRFQAVGGIVQPGGVDEAEQNAVDIERLFDRVACGACDVGYQGPLFAQQTVQKGAFADVGFSDNSDGHPFFDGVAESEPVSYTHLDVYKRQPQFQPTRVCLMQVVEVPTPFFSTQ